MTPNAVGLLPISERTHLGSRPIALAVLRLMTPNAVGLLPISERTHLGSRPIALAVLRLMTPSAVGLLPISERTHLGREVVGSLLVDHLSQGREMQGSEPYIL